MTGETWLLTDGYCDQDHPGTAHAVNAEFLLAGHNVLGVAWYHDVLDGIFGPNAAAAARQCKYEIGFRTASVQPTFGPMLRDYLTGAKKRSPAMLARARARRRKFVWPTSPHGVVIGFPGVGTHSYIYPPNNWESDQAWDISIPEGSKIIAVADGKIGPAFGPLPDPNPRFHGIRLHLETADNEFYYAHLNATTPGLGPGDEVTQGEVLGLSGVANGVPHLHIGLRHLLPLTSLG